MKFWNFQNVANVAETDDIELRIDGEIVDDEFIWLYEWAGIAAVSPNKFKEELAQYKNTPLTVWIDSFGGSVFAAAGIYNALKEHKAKITVKIDGKALSAASVIAMAGDEIKMSPVALMMIHNPLTWAEGDMHELRHIADVLDEVKESIINAYRLKTGKSRSKISELMDSETWMSAKAAIKDGFADAMLYEADEISAYNPIAYNRLCVQNSVAKSYKKLIEIEGVAEEKNENKEGIKIAKAKLALLCEAYKKIGG